MNEWIEKKERGSLWTMRLMLFLCRHTGPWLVRPLLYPIVAYFFLTSAEARAASRRFYARVKGDRGRLSAWADYWRQLLCFARALLDRIYILSGNNERYSVHSVGRDMLIEEQSKGQGMILLGSHLGSFEACRMLVKQKAGLDVHMVAYFGGSQKIRSVLDALAPELAERIIDPTATDAVFRMREVVEDGGVLAILADRVGIGEKRAEVKFFGVTIELPAGPYLLAHALGCPVYSFFGLLAGRDRYDSYVERIAERVELPRKNRQLALNAYAQVYAEQLEKYCRRYPYNWFNFFDYWESQA